MNRRENTFAILNHEPHDHIGNYMTDIFTTGGDRELFENGPFTGGFDGFGIKWKKDLCVPGEGSPAPDSAYLTDITAWEDLVKFPDPDAYPWEEEAKKQLDGFDSFNQIQEYCMWKGPFIRLTGLMGRKKALCAMEEEPEAVLGLFEAITDYKIRVAERAAFYFKPDTICTFDDVAGEDGPFMSPELYRRLIKPVHTRFNQAVREMGMIPNLYVKGRCDELVGDFADEGTAAWEGCQPDNDLVNLAGKYKDKLAFIGGFDMTGPLSLKESCDMELRQSARDCMDLYGKAGNYMFMGMILSSNPDQYIHAMHVLGEEGLSYGTNYYRNRR